MESYEDKIQVLAFNKFLKNGAWTEIEGKRVFAVDQDAYDYATGKITAREYLFGDQPMTNAELNKKMDETFRPIGESEPFRL